VAAYVLVERRRARGGARFGNPSLLPNLIERSPGWRRHAPAAILLLALALMLVGLARPRASWSVPEENATVVLAIDTSRSMAAKDVKPTRLDAARRAVNAFLDELPSKYRVGVVSFASDARVVAPATHNRLFVRNAIAELRFGTGTALGDGIARSLEVGGVVTTGPAAKQEHSPVTVVVLSDGKDQGSRMPPLSAAQRARAAGVPVHTIAFGTQKGVVDVRQSSGYIEHIQVPPDPSTLRQIATTTGGHFFTAPTAEALRTVYADLGRRIGHAKRGREVTVAFAAGAAVLLLFGGGLSALWFRRLP
jgi:Ca-activated chloride channel family protein